MPTIKNDQRKVELFVCPVERAWVREFYPDVSKTPEMSTTFESKDDALVDFIYCAMQEFCSDDEGMQIQYTEKLNAAFSRQITTLTTVEDYEEGADLFTCVIQRDDDAPFTARIPGNLLFNFTGCYDEPSELVGKTFRVSLPLNPWI
jgi:hypothetical protein